MEIITWGTFFVVCVTLIFSLTAWLLVRSILHKLKKLSPKVSRIIGSLILVFVGGLILLLLAEILLVEDNDPLSSLIGFAIMLSLVLGIISLVWFALYIRRFKQKVLVTGAVIISLVLILVVFLVSTPILPAIESWEQVEVRDFAYADEQGWITLISTNAAGEQRYYRKEDGQWVRKASEAEMAYIKPCSQPLAYTILSTDPRFGISEERFLSTIKEAEAIWEEAIGLNLLVHAEDTGIVKINLVYDERQERIKRELESSSNLTTDWASYNNLLASYETNVALHNEDAKKQVQALEEFNVRNEAYNKRVRQWEDNPTTQEEYDYLVGEYNAIQDISAALNTWNDTINKRVADLNITQAELNILWRQLNFATESHNVEFKQEDLFVGWIKGYVIDIFSFYTMAGLRQTLAHEFGHALGIGHLENQKSIMHYRQGEQNMLSLKPSEEDLAALSVICGITK